MNVDSSSLANKYLRLLVGFIPKQPTFLWVCTVSDCFAFFRQILEEFCKNIN